MPHLFGSSANYAVVILVVLAAFGLLVIVHELGHFAMARLSRMRVERFSVGFGPVLLRRQRGDTEWAVSAVRSAGTSRSPGWARGRRSTPPTRAPTRISRPGGASSSSWPARP